MDILFLLIPLSLALVALVVWALLWAVRSGQFEDLEGPAHRILMDDDTPRPDPPADEPRREDPAGGEPSRREERSSPREPPPRG